MTDVKGWFRANYPGRCVNCQDHFEEGDWVKYTENGIICRACEADEDE